MGYIISKGGNEWLKNLWDQVAQKLGMDTGSFWGNGQMQLLPAGGFAGGENHEESRRGKQHPELSADTIFDRIYRNAPSNPMEERKEQGMDGIGMPGMKMEEPDEPQMKPPEEPGFLYQLLTILTFGIWELTNKKNEKYKKYEKEQKAIEKASKERSRRKLLQNARRQKAMERDYLRQMKMQQDMQAANTQPESNPTVNTQPESNPTVNTQPGSNPTVNTQPESKPEEKKETDIVSKNFNFAQDGGIQESPQAKSNMFQTMLKQEYELMLDNFGPLGGGWGEVKHHAGNILEMFRTMQKDPELKKTIEKRFSEASRKQLTGICQILNYVGEKGEKAKELLLDKGRYEALSPQEKRACARDFVEMNILENMMTNHSMIQKRQEERGIVPGHRNASPRIPEFLMQIGKDPEKSKAMIDKFVDFVEITRAIENMSAEEREALVSSKASIQMRIAKDMKELKAHPPRKELLGDVPQNRKEQEKTEQKKGPEPLEKENSMEQPMLHQ